jgi:hypothetical protein
MAAPRRAVRSSSPNDKNAQRFYPNNKNAKHLKSCDNRGRAYALVYFHHCFAVFESELAGSLAPFSHLFRRKQFAHG